MTKEIRLCELELRLYRETQVFNGGIKIQKKYYDDELSSIKVFNHNYIDSTDNANQRLATEWMYTLVVADGKITHVVGDYHHMVKMGKSLKGTKVLSDDTLVFNNS